MKKESNLSEENPEEHIIGEPAVPYGNYTEIQMELSPPLTEEEEKDLLTGEEFLDAVLTHIDELFGKK